MKRNLYDSIRIIPAAGGAVIDRDGCLSAVIAADAAATALTVTHSETEDGEFTAVEDPSLYVGCAAGTPQTADEQAIWQIDLIGCKRYVTITAAGATTCIAVLGDKARHP